MISAAQALSGTGPVYSDRYYSRAADYQAILNDAALICRHEIYGNRAPDDRVCVSSRLDLILEELRSVVTRLEALQESDPYGY